MKLIFFTHPAFINSLSMPRFASMLVNGMAERGHSTEIWTAQAKAYNLPSPSKAKKWLGYVDQYVLFPREVKRKLAEVSPDTLFVFTDQALGMWVPLVAHRPHVIHCHDFLAQRSALGEIPQNRVQWTGKQYQKYIREGYQQGRNFVVSSSNTLKDLKRFVGNERRFELVYNGLNQSYTIVDPMEAKQWLSEKTGRDLSSGYLLHVGGNQWYKNRIGVIELYDAWRDMGRQRFPLLLIGPTPSKTLSDRREKSRYKDDILVLSGKDNEFVRYAYQGATVFLFPSLSEGFGWPVAEAMACGCPVVTTDEEPMSEVAGNAGFLIPLRPFDDQQALNWAAKSANVIDKIVSFTPEERQKAIDAGLANAKRFDTRKALDRIESIYREVLQEK